MTMHASSVNERLDPALSIVIPTKSEASNIGVLLSRIQQATKGVRAEVVFVDDSSDETPEVIRQSAEQSTLDVSLIARPPERRGNGLGGAVVEGLRLAQAPWVCVMDADLQHPPELIPHLLDVGRSTDADLVVASRDLSNTDRRGLSLARAAVTRMLTGIARLLFPKRLRGVSDPLTGFFLLRRNAINPDALRPRGFKILLEVLVRFPQLRVTQILFQFGKRYAGRSKASFKEVFRYFSLLWSLHAGSDGLRLARFMTVGFTGLFVNSYVLAVATEWLGVFYMFSALLATIASSTWNFVLTEVWVFSDRRQSQGIWLRFALFFFLNNLALVLRWPIMFAMTSVLGIHYLVSNLFSLIVLTILRYRVSDGWIWGARQTARPAAFIRDLAAAPQPLSPPALTAGDAKSVAMLVPVSYNIHNIISVVSEVALPELERFATSNPIDNPTIRVRIDRTGRTYSAGESGSSGNGRRIRYDEGLGLFGFSADIRVGDGIELLCSPLLQHSPHVLYTNVVEPILRWTFVSRGYALVHAACIAFGERAYMVTARTDTGKTTTLLQILNHQRRATDNAAFVSDDLTLVSPEGMVLIYPKPLTISFHTMRAVNNNMVSGLERMRLHIQSRVHSRSGRKVALRLAATRLPMSTVNALIQWAIPPPKYHVQRLMPRVKFAREAKLAGLFIIERGADAVVPLESAAAMEVLLSNCEDAYGFPPYNSIKEFLYRPNGHDLRPLEREIITKAFGGLPATLIRSASMNWWTHITTQARPAGEPGASREERSPLPLRVDPALV